MQLIRQTEHQYSQLLATAIRHVYSVHFK